eukprot:Seg129.8 transcript_id=Seg129.8/GoldUCD/mRNA.D3Y31 product="hypothetical protein" protein_id=Seg129.8/GoldUCD/D3Y31
MQPMQRIVTKKICQTSCDEGNACTRDDTSGPNLQREKCHATQELARSDLDSYRGLEALRADKELSLSITVPWLLQKVHETLRYKMIWFTPKSHLEWTVDEFIQALAAVWR